MPSDQNPWNLGGSNGPRRPNPPGQGPWGGPGQLPPEFERMFTDAKANVRRMLGRGGSAGGRGLVIAILAILALWVGSGIYRVQPDELGLVMRFGAYVRSTPPGLNYHLPYPVETVQLLSVTRINRVEIGFRSAATDEQEPTPATPEGSVEPPRGMPARDLAEESLMLTGDENIVDINASVFWRISNALRLCVRHTQPRLHGKIRWRRACSARWSATPTSSRH